MKSTLLFCAFLASFFTDTASRNAASVVNGAISTAAPLRIKVLTFMNTGEGNDTYYFMVDKATLQNLTTGSKFDLVSEQGDRFKCVFKRYDLAASSKFLPIIASVGDNNRTPLGNLSNTDFYIVNTGAAFPSATTAAAPSKITSPVLTANLNGSTWSANGGSSLFYEGGNSMIDKTGKPYFMLSFLSANAPDNRNLTLQFKDFKPVVGKIKSNMQVLLAGHSSGEAKKSETAGYQVNPQFPEQMTNFAVEVTKWERISKDKAIISGKFSGKLKGIMNSADVSCQNGVFKDVEVVCYTGKY